MVLLSNLKPSTAYVMFTKKVSCQNWQYALTIRRQIQAERNTPNIWTKILHLILSFELNFSLVSQAKFTTCTHTALCNYISILCLTKDVSTKVMRKKSVTSARSPRNTSAQPGDRYGVTSSCFGKDHDISVAGSRRDVTLQKTYPLQTCYERIMLSLLHAVCLKVLVFYIHYSVWFYAHGTAEIGWITVLFVWSFASVTMLRADTVSYYHSICRHIQSQTVSEHNASCEYYSSHIETKILAIKLKNEFRA